MIGYKKHSGGFIRGPHSGVFKIPPLNATTHLSRVCPMSWPMILDGVTLRLTPRQADVN